MADVANELQSQRMAALRMYRPTSDDGLTLSFVNGLTSSSPNMKDPAALSKAAWSLFPSSKERKVAAGATALVEVEESTERPTTRRRLNLNDLSILNATHHICTGDEEAISDDC